MDIYISIDRYLYICLKLMTLLLRLPSTEITDMLHHGTTPGLYFLLMVVS
jgi:hypothetical protein